MQYYHREFGFNSIIIKFPNPMRKVLSITVIIASFSISSPAQASFDKDDYYQWFSKQSQTEQLFQDNTSLYIFGNNVKVQQSPFATARTITRLDMGHSVTNIAYDETYVPEDEINGYGDIWYHVKGTDAYGKAFTGFIWGANIAKAWIKTDVDNDRKKEFILLGISSQTRQSPSDIKAELRMIKDGKNVFQQTVPGLCLFKDCATSSLLRFIKDDQKEGMQILEATTMAIGCDEGIEKMLMIWNGLEFETVFHSEMTSNTEFVNKEFIYTGKNKQQQTVVQVCQYSHNDKNYNPVWSCKLMPAADTRNTTVARAKPKA